MKKYQMPNVKEVRLESSLFIMEGGSPEQIQPGDLGIKAPRHTL